MSQKSILFVCTGNIFRSMTAYHAFKDYLQKNNVSGWKVGSAGIVAKKQNMHPMTKKTLDKAGINVHHKQHKLTQNILKKYDIVVAMGKNHYDIIKNDFHHHNVILFNELAIKKAIPILDIEEEIKDYKTNKKAVDEKVEKTVNYIIKHIPKLFEQAEERYYLFANFSNGKKTHRNGYPLIKLYETKHTLAFMSIDIPKKEDGHILVIPKKRYAELSHIPQYILNEIIHNIKHIGKAITKNHGGYNVLLNNGSDAGQYIFHTHFHIIPRTYNDGIEIEIRDREKVHPKEFIALNNKLLEQIQDIQ